MTDHDLYEVLDRAADPVGEVDLLEAAWTGGRRQRNRHRVGWAAAGGVLVAAAVLGVVSVAGPLGADEPPAPAGETDAPMGPDGDVERGTPEVLVFGDDFTLGESRLLEAATTSDVETGQWQLMEGLQPVYPQGVGVRLTYTDGEWTVRACGLDLRAQGGIAAGRVEITSHWRVLPDPDPGAGCAGGRWHSVAEWESLMAREPWVGTADGTLVLAGWTPEDLWTGERSPLLAEATMAFARTGVADPEAGAESAVTSEMLDDQWVEVPAAQATAALGDRSWADPDPRKLVRMGMSDDAFHLSGSCNRMWMPGFWSLDAQTFLLGGFLTTAGCTKEASEQDSLVQALFSSYPQMRVNGDYLVVTGRVPEELVSAP